MWGTYYNRVTIRRRTSHLLPTTTAAATLSPTYQPPRESLLEAHVSGGTDNTGELTFAGLSGGVLTTEVLTFSGAGYRRTTNAFTSITGLTSSGLADEATVPSVRVRAVGHDNSPQQAVYTLVTGYPAQVDPASAEWYPNEAAGRVQQGGPHITMPYAEHFEPRIGDLIDDDLSRTWEVQGVDRQSGTVLADSWRIRVKRWEHE